MPNSTLYSIYADLVNAIKNVVGVSNVYLKDRPKQTNGTTPKSRFVVIDLPARLRDQVVGYRQTYVTSSGILYLFSQAKSNGTLELNATGELVDDILALFPINGENVSAVKPVVQMTGYDDNGFQVTTVTFDLRSKWGALSNQT